MLEVREALNQVWEWFRRSGVTDDLTIIGHIAAVLLGMRGIEPPGPGLPWPEAYPGKDLDSIAREEIAGNVAAAVRAAGTDNPHAEVLDPFTVFRPSGFALPGEYPTPRHVVALMHRLAAVQPEHDLLDLTCGSGGMIARRESGGGGDTIGVELAARWACIAAANAALRLGGGRALVLQQNAVSAMADPLIRGRRFHRVLMNPPFGEKLDRTLIEQLGTTALPGRSETVLTMLALDALKEGGCAAVLLPGGPLFSNGSAETALRRRLLAPEHHLRAVIAFPQETFQPYNSTQTHLVLVDRVPAEGAQTWFFRLAHDGYPARSGRNLTRPPDEPSDFPLVQRALGAGGDVPPAGPDGWSGVPVRVEVISGRMEGMNATEGIVLAAHPEAVLESVEWHPPTLSPTSAEPGFVLLLSVSFAATAQTFIVRDGGSQVSPLDNPEQWRRVRYPRRAKDDADAEPDAEREKPRFYDLRLQGERGEGGCAVITREGVLLGRTVPAGVVRDTLDPRPDSWVAAGRTLDPQVSSADLLREIRERQREITRHLDTLSTPSEVIPRAGARPEPVAGTAELLVFGALSPAQERIYRAVLARPPQLVKSEDEPPYPVVAPFNVHQVVRALAAQQDPGTPPEEGANPAFVQATLQILEAQGVIVRAHLPPSAHRASLPYYRLATRYDEPASDALTALSGEDG